MSKPRDYRVLHWKYRVLHPQVSPEVSPNRAGNDCSAFFPGPGRWDIPAASDALGPPLAPVIRTSSIGVICAVSIGVICAVSSGASALTESGMGRRGGTEDDTAPRVRRAVGVILRDRGATGHASFSVPPDQSGPWAAPPGRRGWEASPGLPCLRVRRGPRRGAPASSRACRPCASQPC
jgi:hypothetical protein